MFIFKVSSIKRSVTALVILITTLLVALACLVVSLNFIHQTYTRSIELTEHITDLVASHSAPFMVYAQAENANRWLQPFAAFDEVEHIHLYRYELSDDSLNFLASYYHLQEAPIPVRFDRVTELTGAVMTENYIEAARAVKLQDSLQGYVYVRTSRAAYDEARTLSLVMSVAVTTASLILSWMMSFWLRRSITQPIDVMVNSIQDIARQKHYDKTLQSFELQELDRVAQAFNGLLHRIQQHIQRQQLAEQQANELNTELEQQVEQRTEQWKRSISDLQEALDTAHQYHNELVEAKKMKSLTVLVAGVAHEVNTPVGLAVTSSSILQDNLAALEKKFFDKSLTSKEFERHLGAFKENLDVVVRNIKRTANLISRFSSLSMDQINQDERVVNLANFWQEMIQSLTKRYPELAQVTIAPTIPADLTVIVGAAPMQQVLTQLLLNSLQHAFTRTEQPRIELTMSVAALPNEDERVELSIIYRDNGDGIPPEIRNEVFTPFVTTKRFAGATGLGLHYVFNLVTVILQGHIKYQSEADQGTEFHLTIPVRRATFAK